MAFAVRLEEEKKQENAIRGHYQKAAVGCWFTASGRALPQMVKYEDEEGNLQMIHDIRVKKTEQKYYAGILCHRYDCCAVIDERLVEFTLLYHPAENKWDMIIPDI